MSYAFRQYVFLVFFPLENKFYWIFFALECIFLTNLQYYLFKKNTEFWQNSIHYNTVSFEILLSCSACTDVLMGFGYKPHIRLLSFN